jgi:RsmE family RNA methyltransferase
MYFYIPDLEKSILTFPHSAHFLSMRVKENDSYKATDLKGNTAEIIIKSVDKKNKSIKIQKISNQTVKNKLKHTLIQAIPDKVYLDKLVEILPLSQVKNCYFFWSDRSVKYTINWERLENILIRSCEQSQIEFKPELKVIDLEEFLRLQPIIMECQNLSSISIHQAKQVIHVNGKAIAVGPEGGWSQQELKKFKDTGLDFVHIDELILPSWLAGFKILS